MKSILHKYSITLYIYIITVVFCNIQAQVKKTDSTYYSKKSNFQTVTSKAKIQDNHDFELMKKAIINSPFIKGYHYKFNLNQLESIFPFQEITNSLTLPNHSLFNKSLLKNKSTDIQLKSYVNINGAAQIVTFKGDFFKRYNGNYTLQLSYRLSPNDYNVSIPNLIKQEVQRGLALKLKINLENGNK